MKGSLFPWFLFISFTHAISSMALSSSSNVENQDFDPSKPIMQGIQVQAIQAVNWTMGLYPESDNGREHKGKHIRFKSIKAQRGKGSYGGANMVHRRPNEKSAASSLIARPPLFIITMILTFLACKLHCYSCFSLSSVSLRCP